MFGKSASDDCRIAFFVTARLGAGRRGTLEAALAEGPATYLELMAALGSRDGRELLGDFDKLYQQGRLKRLKGGAMHSRESPQRQRAEDW